MKVMYSIKVIVNGKDIDDWGLGPGVLCTDERGFEIKDRKELESWPIINALMTYERELIELAVRCEVEEIA